MKFDFNKPAQLLSGQTLLIDYNDGKPAVAQTLGMILGNNLASLTKGDIIKLSDWAKALYHGKVIDLDRGDQKTMRSLIEGFEKLSIFIKSQLLDVLDGKSETTEAELPAPGSMELV